MVAQAGYWGEVVELFVQMRDVVDLFGLGWVWSAVGVMMVVLTTMAVVSWVRS